MTRIFKTVSTVFPVFHPFSWIFPFHHSYTSGLFRWAVSIGFLVHKKIAVRPWRWGCALEAMNSKSCKTKISIWISSCKTLWDRKERGCTSCCLLSGDCIQKWKFLHNCDKERFLLLYSKADFRILGKVSDIKCHLCRCPLKWTTCW